MYFGLPTLYWLMPHRPPLLLMLVLWALVCITWLMRDRTFVLSQLGTRSQFWRGVRRSMWAFVPLGFGLLAALWLVSPEQLFALPRGRPGLWALIMVGYPVVSVYPQEVIFRAFVFHRYRRLLRTRWAMVFASSAAFGYAHVMFKQPEIAVSLTAAGGLIFGLTYARTRSLAVVALEHSLYGCLLFTIGMGEFFYLGPAR